MRRRLYAFAAMVAVLGTTTAAAHPSSGWVAEAESRAALHTGFIQSSGLSMGSAMTDPGPWSPGEARGQWSGVDITRSEGLLPYMTAETIEFDYAGDPGDYAWEFWGLEDDNTARSSDCSAVGDPRPRLAGRDSWHKVAEGARLDQRNTVAPMQVRETTARQRGCLVLIASENLSPNQSHSFAWRLGASSYSQGGWSSVSPWVSNSRISPLVSWAQRVNRLLTDFSCTDQSSFGGICGWQAADAVSSGVLGETFDVVDAGTPSGRALRIFGEFRAVQPVELDPSELTAGDVITATMRIKGQTGTNNAGVNFRLSSGTQHGDPHFGVLNIQNRVFADWTDLTITYVVPEGFSQPVYMRLATAHNTDADFLVDFVDIRIDRD